MTAMRLYADQLLIEADDRAQLSQQVDTRVQRAVGDLAQAQKTMMSSGNQLPEQQQAFNSFLQDVRSISYNQNPANLEEYYMSLSELMEQFIPKLEAAYASFADIPGAYEYYQAAELILSTLREVMANWYQVMDTEVSR